jgi:hypothetical protein
MSMAQHGGAGVQDLPVTWPFRAAGTVLILTLSWFCLGFAIKDLGPESELDGHMPVFWLGLAVTIALVVLGAAINIPRELRRKRHG